MAVTNRVAGDADRSIAPVYRELRGALLAHLYKLTGDAQASEDLLHDVMLKVLTHEKAGRAAPENLGGWLHTVARNAAIDWHRARRPHEELPEALAAPTDDDDDVGLELAHCVRPMAERLPAHYRDTVVAAEFEGRPLKQVAAAQGISLAAAKTRASRGRKLLQQELVECCRVVLSDAGQVVDYDTRAASSCAPQPNACGSTRGGACKT
jgi:RNA polymerase sigma-70 factor, ECF subfamily